MSDNTTPWRPGMLVAGSTHPECLEWSIPLMSVMIERIACGHQPDVSPGQIKSMLLMRDIAREVDGMIIAMTS